MNLLLNMSRQYTPKLRSTVFLIINFSYVVAVSRLCLCFDGCGI